MSFVLQGNLTKDMVWLYIGYIFLYEVEIITYIDTPLLVND